MAISFFFFFNNRASRTIAATQANIFAPFECLLLVKNAYYFKTIHYSFCKLCSYHSMYISFVGFIMLLCCVYICLLGEIVCVDFSVTASEYVIAEKYAYMICE